MVAFKASLSSERVFTRPEGFPLVQNYKDLSLTLLGQTDHSLRAVVFPPSLLGYTHPTTHQHDTLTRASVSF
eukprot:scaffold233043_cov23-Cyclotella_meneghiniana.AAC.1